MALAAPTWHIPALPDERARIRERIVEERESFAKAQSSLRDTLARRVRELRLASQMSQRDLAERAGIRQALVSHIELGEANVTLDSLLKIAIALKVDFTVLFAANDDVRPVFTAGAHGDLP